MAFFQLAMLQTLATIGGPCATQAAPSDPILWSVFFIGLAFPGFCSAFKPF
jgi:hypothetical protein